MLRASLVTQICAELGLKLVRVTDMALAERRLQREKVHLQSWQDAGYAGEMGYMMRPSSLFARPANFLDAPGSVLVLAVPYASESCVEELKPGFGKVARYAWGRDYHPILREKLSCAARRLEQILGRSFAWRAFSDAVPLLERALANEAGLGFVGKNSLLIRPGYGSFFFIAELLISVQVENDLEPQKKPSSLRIAAEPGSGCGSCRRCLDRCPTGAFSAAGVVDARRCISYLTIEKRSAFDEWEEQAVGEWVFGCDICQEVCPFNHAEAAAMPLDPFSMRYGVGPSLDLVELLSIRSASQFKRRFRGTPCLRPGRSALLRNACAVIANRCHVEGVSTLCKTAQEDPSEMVRRQALRSLGRLQPLLTDGERRRVSQLLVSHGIGAGRGGD